ncbi:purine-nucleoside phosphorylase [Iodobacter ciconiae]|uniref:Purine nucleoside phosphorylase n=1 Tax=Iodobacter ciconiae TaxID=2496266 RepID=A0A3S8ZP86_9NEIS|nr:purine-nucleoside phosphorylase [Iodobacter ciconiae]AZN35242.1 purine-nucleoside phosphorylase [Iodobacter ciconiae]
MNNVRHEEAKLSAAHLQKAFSHAIPQTAVILGSGLGDFTKIIKVLESISYGDIPHFPQSSVAGHKGKLTIAEVADGKNVLIMEGRFHYYEGYTPQEVTFPIAVFKELGIKQLIVSNAAGGCNPSFTAGDIMIIDDHINLTGNHPLIGKNDDAAGPRFLDQTAPYSPRLIALAESLAAESGVTPKKGTYVKMTGPTYETRAEIKMVQSYGADSVGMSTVYEVIMANYFGMEVLGISCITNMATGLAKTHHNHAAVVDVANSVSEKFSKWVKNIVVAL